MDLQPLSVGDSERTILFFVLLGIFAYQGFRRGLMAETAKLVLIGIGYALNQPTLAGNVAIRIINTAYAVVHGMLGGARAAGGVNAAVQVQLIKPENTSIALFLMFLIVIGLGYAVSARLQRANPLAGMVVGLLNGFLLSYLFLPALPDQVPVNLPGSSDAVSGLTQSPAGLGLTGAQVLLAPFYLLYQQVDTWIVPITIVLIVLIAMRNIKS